MNKEEKIESFNCGDADLNDFIMNECSLYRNALLAVSYVAETIEVLAAYRFRRAEETLIEIPYLKQQGYYNTAVNRFYYACHYAAAALLIKLLRLSGFC